MVSCIQFLRQIFCATCSSLLVAPSFIYNIINAVLTYLLTYLLNPWSTVLLRKLTGFQLVKKFPAIYGTRRFNTAFTSSRRMSLSCPYPHIPFPEDTS